MIIKSEIIPVLCRPIYPSTFQFFFTFIHIDINGQALLSCEVPLEENFGISRVFRKQYVVPFLFCMKNGLITLSPISLRQHINDCTGIL